MQRANDILGKAVRRMAKPEAVQSWLKATWPSIVGAQLAAQTRPIQCSGGQLDVAASSKEWRRQLENMKDEFCRKINDSWGGALVREVRFVAERPGPSRVRHEDDNEHTPFVRAGKQNKRQP
jgi:predicted nucleic acid-binding Zn ribbon protein